ncbi:MAG: M24 family metallopeptidase [Candidatus Latescibacteria bacterium]|nr:M24 family metallopeptidase [Candidatus Latescibacterota bacterium]
MHNKEAQNAAIDKMKPGVRGWEVDKAARDIIKELVLVKIVSME